MLNTRNWLIGIVFLILLTLLWYPYFAVIREFENIQNYQLATVSQLPKNSELLVSYRHQVNLSMEYRTYCYATFYQLPNDVNYQILLANYRPIFNNEKPPKNYNNIDYCTNNYGSTSSTHKKIIPFFHYYQGVLIYGSSQYKDLVFLNKYSPNIEFWIHKTNNQYAVLVDKQHNTLKLVYFYGVCNWIMCN